MNDEDRLREMLRQRAGSVPRAGRVPAGLIHRAGLRIARNATVALVAVAVVAMGAATGVHALTSSRRTPAATPQPAPPCQEGQLSGASRLMIPTSDPTARDGALVVTNTGPASCSLQGQPVVRVRDAAGTAPSLRAGKLDPLWMAGGSSAPPDWPVVTLQPGDSAVLHIKWTNWCGDPRNKPTTWEVELPGGNGVVRFSVDTGQDIPQCSKASLRSTIKVGPFEPFTRQT